ncbi:MAG: STAS domain-containing protein [Gammaproteobacteria bacterium]|nr:MAG: STAS domain-containing protein [Gammaproteobacteria bacterium]
MDTLNIKRQKGQTRLQLAPVLDISEARNLHQSLGKAMKRKPPLVLDASQVERIDTAAIQILAAFCHSTRENNIEISWDKPSINLRRTAKSMGLNTILGLPA